MEDQIKNMYYDTYFKLIGSKLSENPPDYDWLVTLFSEIKDRLIGIINMTSKNSILLAELEESLDVPLFKQMIVNNAYSLDDFTKLTNYLFGLCLKLGSPMRDKTVKEKQNKILDKIKEAQQTASTVAGAFAMVVPEFIKNINLTIDMIYYDLYALL